MALEETYLIHSGIIGWVINQHVHTKVGWLLFIRKQLQHLIIIVL
jgi:hypothetical protein